MIILSQHLVPVTVNPPPSPLQISHFGGRIKKTFGANAPTPSPQNLHQVSANGDNNIFFSSFDVFQTQCSMADYSVSVTDKQTHIKNS